LLRFVWLTKWVVQTVLALWVAGCHARTARTTAPAGEPFELSAVEHKDAEVDAPVASPCARQKGPPDVDIQPVALPKRGAIEAVEFVVKNQVFVPRNVEVLRVEGDDGTLPFEHSFFEGGSYGPPGTKLVLPAYATSKVTIQLTPAKIDGAVRVYILVDERPICFMARRA
jgi:hypothetical protein